jgi:hypothetical protein
MTWTCLMSYGYALGAGMSYFSLCAAFELADRRSIMVDAKVWKPQTSTAQQFALRASGNRHRPNGGERTEGPENNRAVTRDQARISVLTATNRVLWGVHPRERLPEVPTQKASSADPDQLESIIAAELIDGLRWPR